MKKENTAKILMALAMFVFGTLAPFVRNINVSSGELALYRAVLAATLVGIFLFITKQKLSLGSIKKELLLLLLSGAAMGVNWILLFEAYKYTTVSVATLSYYFAPVIVMIITEITATIIPATNTSRRFPASIFIEMVWYVGGELFFMIGLVAAMAASRGIRFKTRERRFLSRW